METACRAVQSEWAMKLVAGKCAQFSMTSSSWRASLNFPCVECGLEAPPWGLFLTLDAWKQMQSDTHSTATGFVFSLPTYLTCSLLPSCLQP